MRTATFDYSVTNNIGANQNVYVLSSSLEYSPWRDRDKRMYTNLVLVSSVGNETMIFPVDGYGRTVWNDLFMSRPAVSDAIALEAIGYRLDTPTP